VVVVMIVVEITVENRVRVGVGAQAAMRTGEEVVVGVLGVKGRIDRRREGNY
jgi:hypothetical protein